MPVSVLVARLWVSFLLLIGSGNGYFYIFGELGSEKPEQAVGSSHVSAYLQPHRTQSHRRYPIYWYCCYQQSPSDSTSRVEG